MKRLEIAEGERKWNGQEILARYGFDTDDIPLRAQIEDGLWNGWEGNWVALIKNRSVQRFAQIRGDGDDYAFGCAVSFFEKGDLPPERIRDIIESAFIGNGLSKMLGEAIAKGYEERE